MLVDVRPFRHDRAWDCRCRPQGPHSPSARQGDAQDGLEFVPSQPPWNSVVHGGHDRVIETVDIEMNKKSHEAIARQVVDGALRSGPYAQAPDGEKIEGAEFWWKGLAAVLGLLVRIPETKGDGVFGLHDGERPSMSLRRDGP